MKNKLVAYVPPLVILLLFVLIMNGSYIYVAWAPGAARVQRQIIVTEQAVTHEQWEAAAQGCEELRTGWRQALFCLQFSAEKDQLESIEITLARLRAFIASRDQTLALAEITELNEHWDHLNN